MCEQLDGVQALARTRQGTYMARNVVLRIMQGRINKIRVANIAAAPINRLRRCSGHPWLSILVILCPFPLIRSEDSLLLITATDCSPLRIREHYRGTVPSGSRRIARNASDIHWPIYPCDNILGACPYFPTPCHLPRAQSDGRKWDQITVTASTGTRPMRFCIKIVRAVSPRHGCPPARGRRKHQASSSLIGSPTNLL